MMRMQSKYSQRIIAWISVIIFAAILSIRIAWEYWITPQLVLQKIILESDVSLSDRQLLEMLDWNALTWASADKDALKKKLEAYSIIREAEVVKIFPNTLKLILHRRNPLVTILNEINGTLVPSFFDAEGHALKVGDVLMGDDVPVISWSQKIVLDSETRFPEGFLSILSDLDTVRNADTALFALISEIEILFREIGGYDLRLYLNSIPIPILIGQEITIDTLQKAALVADILASGVAGMVDEADIRGGGVVYRRVEEG